MEKVEIKVKFKPGTDKIVILRPAVKKTTEAGIVLPQTAQKHQDFQDSIEPTEIYEVILAGENRFGYKSGDKVIINGGTMLECLNIDGHHFYIVNAFQIAGVVTDDYTFIKEFNSDVVFNKEQLNYIPPTNLGKLGKYGTK